jgi:transposase
MFESKELKRIFGAKVQNVTEEELNNEKLHNLYFSPNKARAIKNKKGWNM